MASPIEASEQANRSGLDPRRLVVIFLLVAGLVLTLFLGHALGLIWAQFGWSNPEVVEGLDWRASSILGVVLSLAGVLGTYFHPRTHQLSMEVASELMKVTWPSWEETRVSTFAVVVASLVAAVLLYGMDSLSYSVMVEWLPKLWGKL
jgi:preprotein translocase subunit SecE